MHTEAKPVQLPAVDPVIFHIYVTWLYSDQGHDCAGLRSRSGSRTDLASAALGKLEYAYHGTKGLVELWLLGALLEDPEFTDYIMDEILNDDSAKYRLIALATIQNVIENANEEGGLYRWLIEHIAALASISDYDALEPFLPSHITSRILRWSLASRGQYSTRIPSIYHKAHYHERDRKEATPSSD